MNHKHELLADYLDERITITGMFEKYSLFLKGHVQYPLAFLQDVYAEVEGKQLDLGHVWVQHAGPLKGFNLRHGDRIKCECRVSKYTKRLKSRNEEGRLEVVLFNLAWPTNIEIVARAKASEPVPPLSVAAPSNPVGSSQAGATTPGFVLDLKRLAEQAGGWDALMDWIGALRE